MTEFKVGDQVRYKPYGEFYWMYVVEMDVAQPSWCDKDIPSYGLATEKTTDPRDVTSVTTGRSIMESKYFVPYDIMED